MKKVDLKLLKKLNACNDAIVAFKNHQPDNNAEAVIEKAMELCRFDWANWLLVRLMSKKQKVQYAIYAAELVLHYFEEKYPKDGRPRKAIEAAKAYVKRQSKKNKNADATYATYAAYAAADAAAADADADADAAYAAYAAADAADAAYAAAADADADAAYAAYAAADAADAAYAAAADAAAADAAVKTKIIRYGIEIIS